MDEATASIDSETDQRIQQTIREEFAESTVITIAHRLDTIIDNDKIIVMENGLIAEMGTPRELLEKKNGIFLNMVEKTGMSNSLREIATTRLTSDTKRRNSLNNNNNNNNNNKNNNIPSKKEEETIQNINIVSSLNLTEIPV